MSKVHIKERYKAQILYYVNISSHLYRHIYWLIVCFIYSRLSNFSAIRRLFATFIQSWLDTLLNLPFMIEYLRFYVPLKNFSLIWRRHQCRWRAAKFRPMLGAQGLWAGRDLYRATLTVTRDPGFSGLIRRTALISRLLRHAWGCGEPIPTRILTGQTCH
jgi:hypothetical protein